VFGDRFQDIVSASKQDCGAVLNQGLEIRHTRAPIAIAAASASSAVSAMRPASTGTL
jgi:hypothetical protein